MPKHAGAATWSVDRFLAASRLRHGGAIACHSALELQGGACTHGHDVQVIAQGEPGMAEMSPVDGQGEIAEMLYFTFIEKLFC